MAGIGFELRKILSRDSYTATLRAYLYAGLISSGPGAVDRQRDADRRAEPRRGGAGRAGPAVPDHGDLPDGAVADLHRGLQLFFTRFISDRLFERKHEAILPNLVGVLLLVTLAAGLLGDIAGDPVR